MNEDGIIRDFLKTLKECDSAEAFYLAQEITRAIRKNKYRLFCDREGNLTTLGHLNSQIFEMLFVYGVMKKGGDYDERFS